MLIRIDDTLVIRNSLFHVHFRYLSLIGLWHIMTSFFSYINLFYGHQVIKESFDDVYILKQYSVINKYVLFPSIHCKTGNFHVTKHLTYLSNILLFGHCYNFLVRNQNNKYCIETHVKFSCKYISDYSLPSESSINSLYSSMYRINVYVPSQV